MLKKIKSIMPIIALVVMVLGSCYLSGSDEKKTTAKIETSNGQINELYKN